MNRYRAGGASRASATTLCQKCLKRGHYSYECTAATQDRPYVSRPSRTQQLSNPKLAPPIVTEAPPAPVANGNDARKRRRGEGEARRDGSGSRPSKRTRSVSAGPESESESGSHSDSDSVSTISTTSSRSPSPPHAGRGREHARHRRRHGSLTSPEGGARRSRTARHDSRGSAPPYRRRPSSTDSMSSRSRSPGRPSHGSGRRRRSSARASRSRSPYRGDGRSRAPDGVKPLDPSNVTSARRSSGTGPPGPSRERSPSPYTKRLALTQATRHGG